MVAEIEQKRREMDHAMFDLAELIVMEATNEERARMRQPWRYHAEMVLQWAVGEAKSADPLRSQRWSCVLEGRPPPPASGSGAPAPGDLHCILGQPGDTLSLFCIVSFINPIVIRKMPYLAYFAHK